MVSGKEEWDEKRRGGLGIQALGSQALFCVICIAKEFEILKLNLLNMPV